MLNSFLSKSTKLFKINKLNKRMRKKAAGKNKWSKVFSSDASTLPKRLLVATTFDCSASCPHCYMLQQNRNVFSNRAYMQDDLFFEIIDSPFVDAVDSIGFCGGEALLNDHIFDWLNMVSTRNIPEVSLASNGISLKDDKIVDKLLDQDVVTGLNISLDATTKEGFCKARGISNFDFAKMCFQISRITERFRDTPTKITGSFVVKHLTAGALTEIVHFSESLHLQKVRILAFHNATAKKTKKYNSQMENDYFELENQIKRNCSFDTDVWIQRPFAYSKKRFYCPSLAKYLCIGANGDLAPCCHMPWDQQYGNFRNASENPINHPNIRALRKQFILANDKRDPDFLPKPCRSCNKRAPDIMFYRSKKKKWVNR
jgi:radical SAM protein with 4Fe4S-binding SPASM domain